MSTAWITIEESARICSTTTVRIEQWIGSSHLATAEFDGVQMVELASLYALFERNRIRTMYDDICSEQKEKPRTPPSATREYLALSLERAGFSGRVAKACRELKLYSVEQLLIHLHRFGFSRLMCIRNFGVCSRNEVVKHLCKQGLAEMDKQNFRVVQP
ncbi:DNA-binding protein [Bacteroides nordii]|uniref:DNA-binding protein n=1 Tax=Bacteroides nordii TaxID=291645 RepID=UPI0024906FDE|nr:DNA-binding protein [Bacteroides nordii]